MGYIIKRFRLEDGQRKKGLKKMHRRAVKSWKARCPSIRRRRYCVRGTLFLLAVGAMAWAGMSRDTVRWVREQIPHMVWIGKSSPTRAADRDEITSVKRDFTIHLDEREIYIYQVEEGYESRERSGDLGSDQRDGVHSLGVLMTITLILRDIVYHNFF